MAYFLVTGTVPRALLRTTGGYLSLSCRSVAGDGRVVEHKVAVMQSGRVHDIVDFPGACPTIEWRDSCGESIPSGCFAIRRLGWLERMVRMLYRVVTVGSAYPAARRRKLGLSISMVLRDLPEAFRIATKLRMTWPVARYNEWAGGVMVLGASARRDLGRQITKWVERPWFDVVVVAEDRREKVALQETMKSISDQVYRDCSVRVLDRMPRLAELVVGNSGDGWLMLLRAGDRLAMHALYEFARASQAHPDALVIYSDDDVVDSRGERREPRFKPDWSMAHLRSTNYIGSAVVLRARAIGASREALPYADEETTPYDLLLRVVERAKGDEVVHAPYVLLHRDQQALEEGSQAMEDARDMTAIRAHIERRGLLADVIRTRPGCWRVRYALPAEPPMVSIIVPTRDAVTLLRRCVASVLEKTSYPRFEILVVDNQSKDTEALAYLNEIAGFQRVRVLRYDAPFNYSSINNFAVSQAVGEVVCLLNNDTEIIAPDWLEEMVGHLLQDRVAVVGAKLYFPDGRVQHGGDIVGPGGCAHHLHYLLGHDEAGYCNRAVVAQELSAVTGACLLTWADVYKRLGGLDEKHLPVAFNDVDFCLRARAAGYKVVWTPHAELYHHESVSRGKDKSFMRRLQAWREVRYMRQRWREAMRHDPFYNSNFSYKRPDFVLAMVSERDDGLGR